jgi:hypothetical protein
MIDGSRPAVSFNGLPSMTTSPPPPPAASGTKFDANAACTPGNASMRRTMSSTRRDFASAGSYASPGM